MVIATKSDVTMLVGLLSWYLFERTRPWECARYVVIHILTPRNVHRDINIINLNKQPHIHTVVYYMQTVICITLMQLWACFRWHEQWANEHLTDTQHKYKIIIWLRFSTATVISQWEQYIFLIRCKYYWDDFPDPSNADSRYNSNGNVSELGFTFVFHLTLQSIMSRLNTVAYLLPSQLRK